MTPDVIPISVPSIDTKNLITYSVNFLDRKPLVDLKLNNYQIYLKVLEILQGGDDAILLTSLNFGFLIHTTPTSVTELAALCQGSVVVAKERTVVIITMTLLQWWQVSICNATHLTKETQLALNKIYFIFSEQLGLKSLWQDYTFNKTNQLVLRR